MFHLREKTKCQVWKKGVSKEWVESSVFLEMEFGVHGSTDGGGKWLFDLGDGLLLKVAPQHVEKPAKDTKWIPLRRGIAGSRRNRNTYGNRGKK